MCSQAFLTCALGHVGLFLEMLLMNIQQVIPLEGWSCELKLSQQPVIGVNNFNSEACLNFFFFPWVGEFFLTLLGYEYYYHSMCALNTSSFYK